MKTKYRGIVCNVLFIGITVLLLIPGAGFAGCYSDHCANQNSGSTSSAMTLRHGGTYGQAATNNMNYRHGYGTGANNHYYSPNLPVPGGAQQAPRAMTPQERMQYEQAMRRSNALVNQINNDPRLNGRPVNRPMTPQQRMQYEQSMQQSNALMNRINNDPVINGRPMTYQEQMEYNRGMQETNDLINRINNDPLINGGTRY